MPSLVVSKGPQAGQYFPLSEGATILGRERDSDIALDSLSVSRRHARIRYEDGRYFIEDLHSSNGTLVNGEPALQPTPLSEGDEIQIGPYGFVFRNTSAPKASETDLIIREEVHADPTDKTLYGTDPARKLEAVLAIGQQLASALDLRVLLDRLLERLFALFPQADRGLVLLCDDNKQMTPHAHRSRREEASGTYPYSRTVVQRVLDEGVGILSDDVRADLRFRGVATIAALDLRSLLCVPLINATGKRLGVLQLDCVQGGNCFGLEDLKLLTAIGLQVSVALENAILHEELMQEERLHHELTVARQIQQGFLSVEFPSPEKHGFELHARVRPAREVSGDLYDFFFRADGRLVFLVGDVSGKGIPAALFMLAVRTLVRHPDTAGRMPSDAMRQLNASLSADNHSGIFVTMAYGIYDPKSGELVLASSGHPLPMLRRVDGRVETVPLRGGGPLGLGDMSAEPVDYSFTLGVHEILVLYTDGITEAAGPDRVTLFGIDRLQQAVAGAPGPIDAAACAANTQKALEHFTSGAKLQDDQTLLVLRRLI